MKQKRYLALDLGDMFRELFYVVMSCPVQVARGTLAFKVLAWEIELIWNVLRDTICYGRIEFMASFVKKARRAMYWDMTKGLAILRDVGIDLFINKMRNWCLVSIQLSLSFLQKNKLSFCMKTRHQLLNYVFMKRSILT